MIIFEKIRFKNFLSFGNSFSEIDFTSHKTTLISGKNANGKSSTLEALTFALYGKPLRKVTKPSLVNNKNSKDCLVELFFKTGNDNYLIRRGIKPNIFEIFKNDVLVNQDAATKDYQKYLEDNILHISYSTFCNTVVISKQSYTSFFRFSAYDRRKFIEELLSLNIFSVMNDINKQNINKLKSSLETLKTNLVIIKTKLDYTINYIKKITKENELKEVELKESINKEIDSINIELDNKRLLIQNLDSEYSRYAGFSTEQLDSLTKKIDSFSEVLIKANIRIEQLENEINVIKDVSQCNSCGQSISDELKTKKISEKNEILDNIKKLKIDAEEKKNANISRRNTIMDMANNINSINDKRIQLDKEIEFLQNKIISNQNQTVKITNIDSEKLEAKKLLNDYQENLELKDSILSELEKLDFVSDILKDSGIKTNIINQYVPVIINYFNQYLLKFGFNIRVDFDSEFNEKFFVNGFHEQSYYNFSAGEMLRLDLAVLFVWRYITKLQKNSDCNILILDEILDASLDDPGIFSFMEILKEQSNLNVFIISHNSDKYGTSFDRELFFTKKSGFSQIIEK